MTQIPKFCASGCDLNRRFLHIALLKSGLSWEIHPAQFLMLELYPAIEGTTELAKPTQYTLMGIPVVVKNDTSMSVIRLMYNDKEIYRIDALAIPVGFEE